MALFAQMSLFRMDAIIFRKWINYKIRDGTMKGLELRQILRDIFLKILGKIRDAEPWTNFWNPLYLKMSVLSYDSYDLPDAKSEREIVRILVFVHFDLIGRTVPIEENSLFPYCGL